jgi:hypothetical protein
MFLYYVKRGDIVFMCLSETGFTDLFNERGIKREERNEKPSANVKGLFCYITQRESLLSLNNMTFPFKRH